MEKIYLAPLYLLPNILTDLKNDNLIHYSFQYYTITLITIFFYLSSKYLYNPFTISWFLFGILPLMDLFVIPDNKNPTREEQKILKREFKYKIPLLISIFADWASFIWGINEIAYGDKNLFYKFGVLFILMILQASSINVSHEMNHKLNTWERVIGTLNLSKNLYMHFLIEHNEGHHKNVATPLDPASAQLNQSLYDFLPKTIYGGFISAWKIENKFCERVYGNKHTIKNKMIFFTLSYILIPVGLFYFFNFTVMITFLTIAFASVIILETINYLEHYGLQRKKFPDGTYENVNITHSWNAPHRISNYLLFKLQRHSDHHENSLKPYQTLCTYDESPTLPIGYAACLLMAYSPSLWFEIMNPIVEAYRKGEKSMDKLNKITRNRLFQFLIKANLVLLGFTIVQQGISFNSY